MSKLTEDTKLAPSNDSLARGQTMRRDGRPEVVRTFSVESNEGLASLAQKLIELDHHRTNGYLKVVKCFVKHFHRMVAFGGR